MLKKTSLEQNCPQWGKPLQIFPSPACPTRASLRSFTDTVWPRQEQQSFWLKLFFCLVVGKRKPTNNTKACACLFLFVEKLLAGTLSNFIK